MLANLDILNNIDSIVTANYAKSLHPGYMTYTFATFDDDLTENMLMFSIDPEQDEFISVTEKLQDGSFKFYRMIPNHKNDTPYIDTSGIEQVHYYSVSEKVLQVGMLAPNILLRCQNRGKRTCSKYLTIEENQVINYMDYPLGMIQKLALYEHMDSWPSMILRLVTAEDPYEYLIETENNKFSIKWDEKRKAITVTDTTNATLKHFQRITVFEDQFVKKLQQETVIRISYIGIETFHYDIPKRVLDMDLLDATKRLGALMPFDSKQSKWQQILDHFFVKQTEGEYAGSYLALIKIGGVVVPCILNYNPENKQISEDSKIVIFVPIAWCTKKSSYKCMQITRYWSGKTMIDYISGDGGCSVYKSKSTNAGSLMVNLGTKIAQRLMQVQYLTLEDASRVKCPNNTNELSLPLVYMLKTGKTWYESKGFIPQEDDYTTFVKNIHTKGGIGKVANQLKTIQQFSFTEIDDIEEEQPMDALSRILGTVESDSEAKIRERMHNLLFMTVFFNMPNFWEVFDRLFELLTKEGMNVEMWSLYLRSSETLYGTFKYYATEVTDLLSKPRNCYTLLLLQMYPDMNVDSATSILEMFSDNDLEEGWPFHSIFAGRKNDETNIHFKYVVNTVLDKNRFPQHFSLTGLLYLVFLAVQQSNPNFDLGTKRLIQQIRNLKSTADTNLTIWDKSKLNVILDADPNMSVAEFLYDISQKDCPDFGNWLMPFKHCMGFKWLEYFDGMITSTKKIEDDASKKREREGNFEPNKRIKLNTDQDPLMEVDE